MKKRILIALAAVAPCLLFGAAIIGYQDWQLRGSAPTNPASGFLRTWADNTSGAFKCLTSAGGGCYWSANFGGSTNTGVLPVANGGSGTATPSLVAGTNVTISGSWPNQTIAASGGGGGTGAFTLLGTYTASSASELDITARTASGQSGAIFQTDHTIYEIYIVGLFRASSSKPLIQFSTNGGSTYDTGTNYQWTVTAAWVSGSGALNTGTDTGISLDDSADTENASGGLNGRFTLYNPTGSTWKFLTGQVANGPSRLSGALDTHHFGVEYRNTTAVNAFRLTDTAGNISSVTVLVCGL